MEWPFASGKAQQRLRRQAEMFEMCVRLFSVAEIKDPGKKQPEGKEFTLVYSSRGREPVMLGSGV